jgi:glycosyltransferase involved in cell wall biosynthesis
MRVLYISHFGGLGGAERSLLELMQGVRRIGITARLLCPDGPLAWRAGEAGIPVGTWCAGPLTKSAGQSPWWRSLPRLIAGWRDLDREMDSFRPHLLHVNSTQAMLWSGWVGRRHGCPVVWHMRDFYEIGPLNAALARCADAVVAISKSMLAYATDRLGSAAASLRLIYNGVADLPRIAPSERAAIRRELGVPESARLVVMAGQSIPRKGHVVLLEALGKLSRSHPDLYAWLICDEHDGKASRHTGWLSREAVRFGCARSVRISSGVQQIASALEAADIVAAPSLREPFGRVAVEAMLARRPVVASAVDGLKEIVAEGETGVLVAPDNPHQLAAALARMAGQPGLWQRFGEAGRRRALDLFSVPRAVGEIDALYSTLQA